MANRYQQKQPIVKGLLRALPDTRANPKSVGPWVLVTTILGSSMAFIDGTAVNVALPILQTELHATFTEAQWIVQAYTLSLATLMLVGGSLGDRFGRRRIFAGGTALFVVASVWGGLAADADDLILARTIQGVGGALLVPGSLALISATYGEDQRGRAIGTWSAFTAITMALGPVLGGWLVEHASWRWVFFINVPLAVVVLSILFWRVPESRDDEAPVSLDWWGAILATVGLGTVVYGLLESAHLSLSHPLMLSALAVGALALIAFFFVEARSQAPMMPLSLFRSRIFLGANVLTLFLYSALSGALFFLPFNLIQVQGYSPTAAGAALLPLILGIFLLSPWAGGLADRHGAKVPLVVGPTIAATGYILLGLPGIGGSYWTTFFPGVGVLGVGMGLSVAPLTTVVMGAVETRHAGLASGINNAVSRTAGLLSIAVMGLIVLTTFNSGLDTRMARLEIPHAVQHLLDDQRMKLAGAEVPASLGAEARGAFEQAIAESFVDSFRLAMVIAAGLALASALMAFLTIKGRESERNTMPKSVVGHRLDPIDSQCQAA